jgi:outer membrane lipoprotein-sorting protein
VIELLGTPHTARIYLDGPSKVRFQVMDTLAERDVVRNGNDLWLYNSADNTAAHVTLPAAKAPGTHNPPRHAPADHNHKTPGVVTPEALAQRFLAAADPSTEVTVGDATTVAGRTAYQLVLKPRSTGTLVDSVTLAVDSASGLPLGIELRARGQADPAFSQAFTDISLSAPDSSVFTFTPPRGASVEEKSVPPMPAVPEKKPAAHVPGKHPAPGGGPTVTGKGWDSVVGFPAGMLPADVRSAPSLTQITQAVPGGRALTTSLVTVLMLDDGRVFAGMVPLERLQAAAAPQ